MAYDNESAPILPQTFAEALDALDANDTLREQMSPELITVFMVLKRDEVARYEATAPDPSTREVTEWEINEYGSAY
jgi:glutamine synthetase